MVGQPASTEDAANKYLDDPWEGVITGSGMAVSLVMVPLCFAVATYEWLRYRGRLVVLVDKDGVMLTCVDINRRIKDGEKILARVPGFNGELEVKKSRIGFRDSLQVRVLIDGREQWRTVSWSAVRVAEAEKV